MSSGAERIGEAHRLIGVAELCNAVCPDCGKKGCEDDPLVLSGKCHPTSPVHVTVYPSLRALRAVCSTCGKHVALVAIGDVTNMLGISEADVAWRRVICAGCNHRADVHRPDGACVVPECGCKGMVRS